MVILVHKQDLTQRYKIYTNTFAKTVKKCFSPL